ncbi:hypothetical protein CISG_00476 [Coccidioides immitis RMSCC 3703]|uniref:Uncharacterized protein n=2 Tax=Coccidioides immitis TaxID=5501 RepID=A0A0J8TF07_COCIT|nr:hypothetical protein CIRG_07062 [Coccidioides immitis RMSCC 2394]KMU72167.1 hypothetical protein CISG_00476 [Coccidioides immitis RMSCC 3703]
MAYSGIPSRSEVENTFSSLSFVFVARPHHSHVVACSAWPAPRRRGPAIQLNPVDDSFFKVARPSYLGPPTEGGSFSNNRASRTKHGEGRYQYNTTTTTLRNLKSATNFTT